MRTRTHTEGRPREDTGRRRPTTSKKGGLRRNQPADTLILKGLRVNKAPGLMPRHLGLFLPNILPVGKSKFTDRLVTFWAQGKVLIACHGWEGTGLDLGGQSPFPEPQLPVSTSSFCFSHRWAFSSGESFRGLLVSRAEWKYGSAMETTGHVVLCSAAQSVSCKVLGLSRWWSVSGSRGRERKPGLPAPCSRLCSVGRALTPV